MTLHKFDAVSFVLGAFVVTLGTLFALDIQGSAWIAPVALIGIGIAFVTAAAQAALSHRMSESDSE